MRVRYILGTNPHPTGSLLFNAPRPISGSQIWQGEFLSGIFYALISADEPYRASMIQQNARLDACLIRYITEADAQQRVKDDIVAEYGQETLDGLTDEEFAGYWRDAIYNLIGDETVEPDSL